MSHNCAILVVKHWHEDICEITVKVTETIITRQYSRNRFSIHCVFCFWRQIAYL